jgi:mannitol-1-phosphate 5-dehydrogenase
MSKEILVLGAGNIGRSFITPIFLNAGYRVYLADINTELIQQLKDTGSYNIKICAPDKEEVQIVRGFIPIDLVDKDNLKSVIKRVPLIATSVGQIGLAPVMKLIAETLHERRDENHQFIPLDIILAENMREASGYCRRIISESLDNDFPIAGHVGLVETSIGKMVPQMTTEERLRDPLSLKAEPYNTLILDKDGFVGPPPVIPSVKLVSPIQAWVDRKLFIHNLGHAAAAYLGRFYYPEEIYIASLMKRDWFCDEIRAVMKEGADILLREHPNVFTLSELLEHIDVLIQRFSNPYLGDTVQRVGRDLPRKLGRNDRIVGAMREALKFDLSIDNLCKVYIAALSFDKDLNYRDCTDTMLDDYNKKDLMDTYSELSCSDNLFDYTDQRIVETMRRIIESSVMKKGLVSCKLSP